jgi:hypothetical protein
LPAANLKINIGNCQIYSNYNFKSFTIYAS